MRKVSKISPGRYINSAASAGCCQAKGRRASPLLRAPPRPSRSPRVTGGGVRTLEAASGLGCRGRARSPGDLGPFGVCAPSASSRAPIAAFPPRMGPRAAVAPGSRPLPGSQRVSFSYTTKSLRHCDPPGGHSGRAARAGAGAPPPGPKVEESARGEGDRRQGPRRLDLLVSQLRRRGAEEPVLPKTKPKMGNGEARAALRGLHFANKSGRGKIMA
ncbi:microtubule-associated serine/threonine-protein kinase 1-like [Mustela putorius furo]|uniref:Microtubule-associated serine/threonine-protein kinase 1-like n=1 Tax=Mustela putorius furo TaxID=9669 RepID=A0A8U0R721_MUSPF|nr:microtubule-associated serine/threonine-protein kinase 1-like [Mustela putorius furo]